MEHTLNILVADDEPLIRRKVCMMIGDTFCVDQVATAQAARDASIRGYDAVLLDIVFPDGNGIEICSEIKARDPYCTVVISSSMESVDAWNDAFEAGADGYLEKRELLSLDPRKIVLMIRNLVERNRLKQQAEDLNKRQAELLSVLSHDVRTPFQTLLGTIDLLRKGAMPPAIAKNVETLHHCAADQLAFINSLLEFLRLESGTVGLRECTMNVNLAVNQALQGLRVLAEKKDIRIQSHLEENIPEIRGDLGRICQLLNNLINNSVKFTPRGGTILVSTRSAPSGPHDGIELSVADTGVGIPLEDRERVFQRFRRGSRVGTEGEKGTGLGLSICKEIVQLHHGRLTIDDGPDGGTMIRAWFPIPHSDASHHASSHPSPCVPSRRLCAGSQP